MNRQQRRRAARLVNKARDRGRAATAPASADDLAEELGAAIGLHRAGKLQEAAGLYGRILDRDPQHADATHGMGLIAYQTGRSDTAVDLLRAALALVPDQAEWHCDMGVVLAERGELDEVVECYQRALAIRPNYESALKHLGFALQTQGKLDEAAKVYHRALAVNPKSAVVHNNLGNLLRSQGLMEDAAACFRRALEAEPNFTDAHNNLGNMLKEQGRLKQAAASYRRALEIDPRHVTAHNNLGISLKLQGKIEEAAASYRRAIEIKPGHAPAHCNLAGIVLSQGRKDEAISLLRRAAELDPATAAEDMDLQEECDLGQSWKQAAHDQARNTDHDENQAELGADARPGTSGRTLMNHPAAHRDPGQERREHDREAIGVGAGRDDDRTRPRDFQHERSQARDRRSKERHPIGPERARSFGPFPKSERIDSVRFGNLVDLRIRTIWDRNGVREAIHDQGAQTDRQISEYGDPLRLQDSDRRQENETRGQRTDDGAHRIDRVEAGEALAKLPRPTNESADQDGQCAAHTERRQEQHRESHCDPRRIQRGTRSLDIQRDRKIDVVDTLQEPRQRHREKRNTEFERSVDSQGPTQPPADTTEDEAACCQSAHERGKDDADGLKARAEDERQGTCPSHLIDERCRTRCQEEAIDSASAPIRQAARLHFLARSRRHVAPTMSPTSRTEILPRAMGNAYRVLRLSCDSNAHSLRHSAGEPADSKFKQPFQYHR
ncbi:MAG: tetratricopeptide repeat protein [Proteobacteria bacterium]|nr:tetratricopeptide repeat protein [Pseudomonadota bacterium]